MLLNNFYTILNQEATEADVKAVISFEPSHAIFKGHFPGFPVVPGVCMIQIIREIMENVIGQPLKITTGDNIKFLSIINPEQNKVVEVAIGHTRNGNTYVTNATLSAGAVTFFKFKGTLDVI